MSETRRLIDLLSATDEFFKSKGIESPRRNAEALFAKALNMPRIELYIQHDRPVKDSELEHLRELIRQRSKRVPLQYLLGEVEFFDARIQLKQGLLIPRPETEELVEQVVKILPDNARVLDVGCGTGCISVALAKANSDCTIVPIDIDADAVAQTAHNASLNSVEDRVKTLALDLFDQEFAKKCGSPFDVVISNPPYIREDELPSLEPEVREFENRHALISGPTGFEYYERIAELLPALLPSGIAALEFGMTQAEHLRTLFAPHFSALTIHHDLQGRDRYLIGRK